MVSSFQLELKNRFEQLKDLERDTNNTLDQMNKRILKPLKEIAELYKSKNPKVSHHLAETKSLTEKRKKVN